MSVTGEQMEDLEQFDVDQPKRSFDTPLLIAALVVAGAMLAYFFLGKDSAVIESAPPAIVEATPEEEQIQAVIASESVADELLTRARLAVESGMLAEPSSSNALYYYSLYLEQNPEDAEAAQELSSAADAVGQQVAAAVGSRDWDRATFLVEQIRNAGADSSAVEAFRSDLEAYRVEQADVALAAARRGDEAGANAALDDLAGLPRAEATVLLETRSAVRDALVAYRVEQQAAAEAAAAARRAEQQRAAAARTRTAQQPAAAQVQTDPLAEVRSAIQSGQLTGEAGAIALFEAVPASVDGRAEVQSDLAGAIADLARNAAAAGDLREAERLQGQVANFDSAEASALQETIDRAYIELAVAETVSAATLRRTRAVAPVYPQRAVRRGITGRVKVEFTVAVDGSTRDIEVVESSSGGVFDRASIRAISEWRYEPREVRGQAVAQRVYAYLDYNLE